METPSPIPLAIFKQTSLLDGITLLEYYPKERVEALINSDYLRVDWIPNRYGVIKNYENEKQQLQCFLKIYDEKLQAFKVQYKKPKHKWGRVLVVNALGSTAFSKKVRNTLIEGLYYDFDLKNAQPEIIRNICLANGISCTVITDYCQHRDEKLELVRTTYDVDRATAKKLFLRLCFFGTFEGWAKEENITGTPLRFIQEFRAELNRIANEIKAKNLLLFDTARKLKEAKQEGNHIGSMFALFLQEYEERIVQQILNYLANNTEFMNHPSHPQSKLKVGIYEYDGVKLLKEQVDKFGGKANVMSLLNRITNEITNFELEWEEKPIEGTFDITTHLEKLKLLNAVEINTFEKVSEEFEKNHSKIVNKSLFLKELPDVIIPMSKTQITISYENLVYEVMINGVKGKVNFIECWLRNNSAQRCYDDMGVYPPGIPCPKTHFNLWRPFAMEQVTEYEPQPDKCKQILQHIKILCGKDEGVYDYFVKWIAQMIQYPAVKSICPVLISKQGAGKGTLIKLLSSMLGDRKVMETTTPSRDVWGDFNGMMAQSFLVNLNELSKKETLECEGRFKGLVTDGKLTINNKGVNQFPIVSYHRFIITTNSEEPINTSGDDRRNLIIRSSDEKCGDKEYFQTLHEMIEDVNVVKTCYEYFKSLEEVENFNRLPIPQTEYQNNLKELSVSPIELWLKDFTSKHLGEVEVELLGTETLESFQSFCADNNIEYSINSVKLGVRLSNLNIDGIRKGEPKKQGKTKIFDITKLKKHFQLGCQL